MTYAFSQNYVCKTKLSKQLLARQSLQEMFIEYVNSSHLFDFGVLNYFIIFISGLLKAEKIEDQKTQRYLKGSSIHGILHARILEWVAIPFSRGSS